MKNKKRAIICMLMISFQVTICRTAEEPLITNLTTPQEFDDFIKGEGTLNVVKFHATWCRHSRNAEQPYRELAQTYKGGKTRIRFGEVDVDKLVATRKSHGVTQTPSFLIFKDGSKIEKTTSPTTLREKLSLITRRASLPHKGSSLLATIKDMLMKPVHFCKSLFT